MEEDEELLLRAKAGDRRALEAFYQRHFQEAGRLSLLLSRNATWAEEALQEAWTAVVSSLAAFDPAKGSARSWFFGILRNKVRAQAKRELGRLDLGASPKADPGAAALLREEMEELLARLPEDQREAVVSRWILGWSYEALGEVFGISSAAAKQRSHRGLLALREALGLRGKI